MSDSRNSYVEDIHKELTEAEKIGELDREIFPDADRERLDLLLADPELFYVSYCSNTNAKMKKRVEELENSTTWKVGRVITCIPRKIRKTVKKSGKK